MGCVAQVVEQLCRVVSADDRKKKVAGSSPVTFHHIRRNGKKSRAHGLCAGLNAAVTGYSANYIASELP